MGNSAIRAYKYTPEDVKCEYCTEYRKRRCGAVHGCPWLAERVEAGVVGYKEAVSETFASRPLYSYRLNSAIRRFNGSLWRDSEHERRMTYQKAVFGFRRKRDTPAYYAALYLLTATKGLCDRTSQGRHRLPAGEAARRHSAGIYPLHGGEGHLRRQNRNHAGGYG